MDLVHRLAEREDLPECFRILEDRFCYPPELLAQLPALAGKLLAEGALNSALMEDRARPRGGRIIQFGATVFVTDDYMRELQADDRPHLGRRTVEEVLAGRSPLLSLAEIRAANSREGLNLLVLHFGLCADCIPEADQTAVLSRIPENFLLLHDGFRLKEILVEFIGPQGLTFSRQAGFHPRTDYEDYYQRESLPLPAPDQRPHRLGITHAEAEAAPGTYIAHIFPFRPRRFGFTTPEQRLLMRGLQGDTDEDAARALHVALPTIKTRWRAIYDRVELRAPDFLPSIGVRQSTRGGEKRRLLLHYLRQHLEELRPVEESDLV